MPATRVPALQGSRGRALLGLAVIVAIAIGALAGCGSDTAGSGDTGPGGGSTGTVTVFAAASLKEAFTELGEAFEAANPGATVTFNYAASSALAQQIREGAPADVFASADEANMQKVVDAGELRGQPVAFATNSLEIIVAPGNPERIAGLADLASSDVLYVTAAPGVPVGAYTAEVLRSADVDASPASLQADVKALVTTVTSGEADAAIVYATDVAAAGDQADGVAIPAEVNVVATYPIGVTAEASNPGGAAEWVAFVTGPDGQAILARHGFGPP